ncbi:F-box/LRR-repeat protein 2 isoform X2 [Ursus maritimus]|uniref:F-box/LRR-repeat protein 2 isoform X2 n=1 Tax=Ursus maritimus TaxID=29073 RepID=A0A8M1GBB6_URSMA|nr:F-box/LRR-repeat protein 2 isoform X2 [Ursus maritimus]XP_057171867.1 F-box/LRR-repeat protein 2 isoform X1 [Ursus arctos]
MVFSNNDEGLINKKLPKELLLRMLFSLLLNFTWSNPECTKYVHSIGLDSFCNVAWNILALDGSNWQRIDLFNFQTDVEGRVVENISKRCGGFLRKLSLRGCIGVGDSSLKTFAQNCRNIEHLNLNGCTKITDSTCYSLSRFCSKLKHLDLTSCVSITNSSLKGISEGCRNLEYLNLSWCDQITKDGIEALVRGCRGLKALLLRGCTQLEDEALKHIQNYCHELVSLNFQSCSRITDEGVVQICRGCHRLQALCLSGCSNLTDASLTALALNCPRLQILEAARCSHLTDAGFTLLARNCHDLEKMDLEECILITDSTLVQLSVHCPKLQALSGISKSRCNVGEFPLLHILADHISFTSAILSLSHCELITDDGILHLSNSTCGHERLRVLELDNCLLITDVALEHLENCRGLERLELYDCQQVTRAGIKRMRAQLPHVKVHAYFAPVTPPTAVGGSGQRLCRCCVIL